jgi:hypothetical protein
MVLPAAALCLRGVGKALALQSPANEDPTRQVFRVIAQRNQNVSRSESSVRFANILYRSVVVAFKLIVTKRCSAVRVRLKRVFGRREMREAQMDWPVRDTCLVEAPQRGAFFPRLSTATLSALLALARTIKMT